MTGTDEQDRKKMLSLSRPGRLELKKTVETGQVRQSFPHGRSKTVTVEVKKKRTFTQGAGGRMTEVRDAPVLEGEFDEQAHAVRNLTAEEAQRRIKALQEATHAEAEAKARAETDAEHAAHEAEREAEEARRHAEEEEERRAREAEAKRAEEAAKAVEAKKAPEAPTPPAQQPPAAVPVAAAQPAPTPAAPSRPPMRQAQAPRPQQPPRGLPPGSSQPLPERHRMAGPVRVERAPPSRGVLERKPPGRPEQPIVPQPEARTPQPKGRDEAPATADDDDAPKNRKVGRLEAKKPAPGAARARTDARRRDGGKLTIQKALNEDERMRSLASVRRQREKMKGHDEGAGDQKIVRDVVVPETITVQELANRMAERSGDVIKALMKMGVMATITQSIDADTAELIVGEFGHKVKRVAESDVEIGLKGDADAAEAMQPRPPVVTIMGHVDHGKTSLLDALRHADVAAHEAGGITQHIGAYAVTLESGQKITFIDTPGHEAFTQMRARGANVTDIVILVVAADDGVMPQTIEAINHAKAANVPILVAINKVDKPGVDTRRVKTDLLSHNLVTEDMGGDIQAVEVSAKTGQGLDKLVEAILLQAEVSDLRSNPERAAEGAIIEAKVERGRGSVATVLIQRGTLHVGDLFVAGAEWGRVRALIDDKGQQIEQAGPSTPVEVLGLNGTPQAGDDFSVVDSESRARDITSYRQSKQRDQAATAAARGSVEQMMAKAQAGAAKSFTVVLKSDVQGSLEAIKASLEKLSVPEAEARILHAAVGGINESDVTLAKAAGAKIIGFNVRANPQAREMAKRDGVTITYYSIIYNVIDDAKAALSGMLAPTLRENFLGNASIRQIFNITKTGKVAGCMVTEGIVKRGAKVRLLRDNVVIHEGTLKTLRRFKDEVREVREGFECGMAFENYDNIQVGDVIECFEIEAIARTL
ncbi:MAG: translation initiation factor IF-2 [Rhodospirillaceae bacterium]|nr:translation initiation factor IF-2 [Rhodospirillaceae bacterium]